MNKKVYVKPSIKAHKVNTPSILCGSDPSVKPGSCPDNPFDGFDGPQGNRGFDWDNHHGEPHEPHPHDRGC